MITPRITRLLRVPDLRALQRTIASVLPVGLERRAVAVILPTRSAAEQLRRTLENLAFGGSIETAFVLPDLLTREDWYQRLYERLPDAPPLLTEFEREVLLRLAAEDADRDGAQAPFRLRLGLLSAILNFYDDLRRRGRTIDSLDANVRATLESDCETDRGAARLLKQTEFLSTAFAAFERRIAESGRIDEHALRALLLSTALARPYRHVIVTVADQAADPRGLWPADFDLLSRLPGIDRLDVIATERMLASGWHQRVHDALPELDEVRTADESPAPALLAPAASSGSDPAAHFVSRDREEELADAARWIKSRARSASVVPSLDGTAIVFQRPLPYLYLARQVFSSCNVPYQTVDALPLAAEPFAAALDLVFVAAEEEATRTAIVELVSSPHWAVSDPEQAGVPLSREQIAALDRLLRESKHLGGWDRLIALATTAAEKTATGGYEANRWHRAAPALAAAASLRVWLEPLTNAATATDQINAIVNFVTTFERLPRREDIGYERYMRARRAILGALFALRAAHAEFDNRQLPIAELIATMRRWIEGQTFAPRTGRHGVMLLDARAAAFADVDSARIVGLVESEWPERADASIFYPASLLRAVGWPPESERLTASRAQFQDLLHLPTAEISVSSFTLEEDAIVPPSSFLEDVSSSELPIDRASPGGARIFAHEALSTPVAADAIRGDASDWLELRRGRSAGGNAEYHGTIGAHPVDLHTISRVERFLQCPFKYFAGEVLQLDEEREDESGLTPLERGQLLHGVFEAFFEAWRVKGHRRISAANLGDAIDLFADVAEEALATLPEGDRALERTYLLGSAAAPGLAERAFAFEIEHGVEVVERLLEYTLEGRFTFEGANGSRQIRVRGKADRIDLLTDSTLRIVDYKLGRAPKPGRALQLPIYSVCASQQLDGRHGRSWTLGRAGYVAFKEKNAFVDLRGRTGNLDTALRDGQVRFIDAIERIEAGEFPPNPDEPWLCTRCGFCHICRKDYIGDE